MSAMLGEQLHGYRFDALIGEGAAKIYRAYELALERDVAIKVLFLHRSDRIEEGQIYDRLARDTECARHLCQVHHAWRDGHQGFIVMELLNGQTLAQAIKEEPLPIRRALDILRQTLRVLVVAHNVGIIHRDVKPSNLFLCRDREGGDLVKVLDFGIAKVPDRDFTLRGGTEGYMAPEQSTDAGSGSPALDVFACGVVLFEMITGKLPTFDKSLNTYTRLRDSLSAANRKTPDWLNELVARCLSVDPAARPRDARRLLEELERHWPTTGLFPEASAAPADMAAAAVPASEASASETPAMEASTPRLRPVAIPAKARRTDEIVAATEVSSLGQEPVAMGSVQDDATTEVSTVIEAESVAVTEVSSLGHEHMAMGSVQDDATTEVSTVIEAESVLVASLPAIPLPATGAAATTEVATEFVLDLEEIDCDLPKCNDVDFDLPKYDDVELASIRYSSAIPLPATGAASAAPASSGAPMSAMTPSRVLPASAVKPSATARTPTVAPPAVADAVSPARWDPKNSALVLFMKLALRVAVTVGIMNFAFGRSCHSRTSSETSSAIARAQQPAKPEMPGTVVKSHITNILEAHRPNIFDVESRLGGRSYDFGNSSSCYAQSTDVLFCLTLYENKQNCDMFWNEWSECLLLPRGGSLRPRSSAGAHQAGACSTCQPAEFSRVLDDLGGWIARRSEVDPPSQGPRLSEVGPLSQNIRWTAGFESCAEDLEVWGRILFPPPFHKRPTFPPHLRIVRAPKLGSRSSAPPIPSAR